MRRLQSFVDPNADSAYYPWGEEYASTSEEQEKFATYFRDGTTALDYARNRYYSSTLGRFLTADPYRNSAGPGDPGSWNRYAYVNGDPVNFNDPMGLFVNCLEGPCRNWQNPPGTLEVLGPMSQIPVLGPGLFLPVPGGGGGGGGAPVDPFTANLRKQAKNAINQMPDECKTSLGKLWNLFNGSTSLLNKVNTENFYDARNSSVAQTPMSAWGISDDRTTGEYLAQVISLTNGSPAYVDAFVSVYDGKISNFVILGPSFFRENTAIQGQDLIHEVLHSYTGLGDIDLAFKMGIGGFVLGPDASAAIAYYLSVGCNMGKYRQRYPGL